MDFLGTGSELRLGATRRHGGSAAPTAACLVFRSKNCIVFTLEYLFPLFGGWELPYMRVVFFISFILHVDFLLKFLIGKAVF